MIRKIAHGGFGVVYEAERDGESVAVKILKNHPTIRRQDLVRLAREGKAGQALHHPNIVRVHELAEHEGLHYLVMDYIDGHTLSHWIQSSFGASPKKIGSTTRTWDPMEPPSTTRVSEQSLENLNVLSEIADALGFAHENGFVHRDVKPSNILVDRSGRGFLADFGLTKVPVDSASFDTPTGAVLGSPAYMSPEQITGNIKLVDARSDIYSLGVTIFENVTGRVPYMATTFEELREQVLTHEPPRLSRMLDGVPPGLEDVVLKSIEKHPKDRYSSAYVLEEDLKRVLAHRKPKVSGVHRRRRVRSVRRNRFAIAASAVVALAVVLGVVWKALDSSRSELVTERVRSRFDQAELFAARGQNTDALEAITAAIELQPDSPTGYLRRAAVLAQLGFQVQPKDELARAKALGFDPKDSELRRTSIGNVDLALAALAESDYIRAEDYLEDAVRLNASEPAAWMLLYRIRVRRSDFPAAVSALTSYQRILTPSNPLSAVVEAEIAELEGRFDDALTKITALEQETEEVRHSLRYSAHRGRLLTRNGQFDDAEAALRNAVDLHPTDGVSWLNLAVLRARELVITRSGLDEVEQCARRALENDPFLDRAYRLLTWGGRNFDEAATFLEGCSESWSAKRLPLLRAEQLFVEIRAQIQLAHEQFQATQSPLATSTRDRSYRRLAEVLKLNADHLATLTLLAEHAWIDRGEIEKAADYFRRSREVWNRASEAETRPWSSPSTVWNPTSLGPNTGDDIHIGLFATASTTGDPESARDALAYLRDACAKRRLPSNTSVLNLAEALALAEDDEFRNCAWAKQLIVDYGLRPESFDNSNGARSILEAIAHACAKN